MTLPKELADVQHDDKGQMPQIAEPEKAACVTKDGQLLVDATELWFIVNAYGEIDEATAHKQEEGAKALLVAAKSRRQVVVSQWQEFEAYGWTCKKFKLTPVHAES